MIMEWSIHKASLKSLLICMIIFFLFFQKPFPCSGMCCFCESSILLLLSRFSRVRLCATPQTAAHQAPPSLGFSRQEHWSGLPFPSPMHESEKWKWSRSVVSNPQRPYGLQPTRLLHPWDFPGEYWSGVPLPSPQSLSSRFQNSSFGCIRCLMCILPQSREVGRLVFVILIYS